MDNPIHKGSLPPFPFPDSYQYSARTGQRIESSSTVLATQVGTFLQQLRNNGWDYEARARVGTPYYHVEWVPRDDAAEIVTTWEMAGNELEKSIWELPKVKFEFVKLSSAGTASTEPFFQQQSFLQRVVNGKVAGEDAVPAWKRDSAGNLDMIKIATTEEFRDAITFVSLQVSTNPDFLNKAVFEGLAASLSRGVEAFPISHFVVRRTRLMSANSTIQVQVATANWIFTKEQFVNLERPSFSLLASLPEGYYQRKTPTMTQQRDGTWLVNEEWWHAADYDHFVYDSFFPGSGGAVTP